MEGVERHGDQCHMMSGVQASRQARRSNNKKKLNRESLAVSNGPLCMWTHRTYLNLPYIRLRDRRAHNDRGNSIFIRYQVPQSRVFQLCFGVFGAISVLPEFVPDNLEPERNSRLVLHAATLGFGKIFFVFFFAWIEKKHTNRGRQETESRRYSSVGYSCLWCIEWMDAL